MKRMHARAFTAAKAVAPDLLRDIRATLGRALDEGLTFEQLRRTEEVPHGEG